MSSWTPSTQGLQEILQTLHDSTDSTNREVQKSITLKLNSFTRVPDYVAYLAYILSSPTTSDDRIRTIAGYLLKNNARLIHKTTPEVAMFVKQAVLASFRDGSAMIRSAAGQDIVALMAALEPRNWPEALSALVTMLDEGSVEQQEVRQ